jgi:hypothetical protein
MWTTELTLILWRRTLKNRGYAAKMLAEILWRRTLKTEDTRLNAEGNKMRHGCLNDLPFVELY